MYPVQSEDSWTEPLPDIRKKKSFLKVEDRYLFYLAKVAVKIKVLLRGSTNLETEVGLLHVYYGHISTMEFSG